MQSSDGNDIKYREKFSHTRRSHANYGLCVVHLTNIIVNTQFGTVQLNLFTVEQFHTRLTTVAVTHYSVNMYICTAIGIHINVKCYISISTHMRRFTHYLL